MSDIWAWGVEDGCGFSDGSHGNRHVYVGRAEAENHAGAAAGLRLVPLVPAPQQEPEDDTLTLQRSAELLRRYANVVRECHSSELERFDYLPEIEELAEKLDALALRDAISDSPSQEQK